MQLGVEDGDCDGERCGDEASIPGTSAIAVEKELSDISDVMDNHDLSRPPAPPDSTETWSWTTPVDNENWGLHRLTCPVHALSILQDQLYLTEQTESFVAWLTDHGRTATHTTLSNPHGHDGFLIDSEAVGPWVTKHLIGTHGDRNV